jgi:hypothetical protein
MVVNPAVCRHAAAIVQGARFILPSPRNDGETNFLSPDRAIQVVAQGQGILFAAGFSAACKAD